MATLKNPDTGHITPELWWFWTEFLRVEPKARLGGVFANKPGYHNIRKALPGTDYSVRYALDRKGPSDKAAALDITFPDAQAGKYATIAKYSKRLLASGRDLSDERGNYLREFFGQTDSDREVEGWDFQSVGPATSDVSHLWHIHLSWMRAYVRDLKAMRAVLSILVGESVKTWRAKEAARLLKPKPPTPKPPPPPPPVVPAPVPPVESVPPKPTPPDVPPVLLPPEPPVIVEPVPVDPTVPELPPDVPMPSIPVSPAPPTQPAPSRPGWLDALRRLLATIREWLRRPIQGEESNDSE